MSRVYKVKTKVVIQIVNTSDIEGSFDADYNGVPIIPIELDYTNIDGMVEECYTAFTNWLNNDGKLDYMPQPEQLSIGDEPNTRFIIRLAIAFALNKINIQQDTFNIYLSLGPTSTDEPGFTPNWLGNEYLLGIETSPTLTNNNF